MDIFWPMEESTKSKFDYMYKIIPTDLNITLLFFFFVGESHICEANIVPIYDCFLKALEDYTHDRRGDVGAWVREAAMSGLASLTLSLAEASPNLVPEVCIVATMPKIG